HGGEDERPVGGAARLIVGAVQAIELAAEEVGQVAGQLAVVEIGVDERQPHLAPAQRDVQVMAVDVAGAGPEGAGEFAALVVAPPTARGGNGGGCFAGPVTRGGR